MKNFRIFNFKINFELLAISILTLSLSACKDLPTPGDYLGKISIQDLAPLPNLEKSEVEIKLTYGHHHLTVLISDPHSHIPIMKPLTITQKNKRSIALFFPDYSGDRGAALILSKSQGPSGTCYQSQIASLCFNPDSFNLTVKKGDSGLFHIYSSQFQPARELKLEPPQAYTVSEGVNLIVNKNYNVQEAKQSLLRANETANRSYLNLLPHTSVGGVLTVATVIVGNYFEITRPINDLISFIFPGRWLKAEATLWQAHAERMAYALFQLTIGTSVQTQAISFRARRDFRDQLQALQTQVVEVLKIANDLMSQNRIDANSILTIEVSLSDLNVLLKQAQNQFMQDKLALSQTLGFENPEAVEDIILESETATPDRIHALNDVEILEEKKKYSELAVNNSFELRQLDYLRRSAVLYEKNVFVNWMDVFSVIDLGANLVPDARIAQSMIKSVEIKSEKTRQALIVKVYNLVRDRNLLKLSLDVLEPSIAARRERLNLLIERLKKFAASTDPTEVLTVQASDIRGSVKDTSVGLNTYYSTKAAMLVDQTVLDRLALQGVYEKFLPRLDGEENTQF